VLVKRAGKKGEQGERIAACVCGIKGLRAAGDDRTAVASTALNCAAVARALELGGHNETLDETRNSCVKLLTSGARTLSRRQHSSPWLKRVIAELSS
jgi:hypothetical protein